MNIITFEDITAPMNKGSFHYTPPKVVARNGTGNIITAPFGSATWTFSSLTPEELQFFNLTLLEGKDSKIFSPFSAYDENGLERTWAQCILQKTSAVLKGTYFRNVVVKMEQIR